MVTIWATIFLSLFTLDFCLIFISITNRKSVFVTAIYVEIMKFLKKKAAPARDCGMVAKLKKASHPGM
ncbi:hypothetical protein HDC90_005013 [Pedobacter sp. AK013]|nr:hypothetical protein [Pedobacter sp. AK013]